MQNRNFVLAAIQFVSHVTLTIIAVLVAAWLRTHVPLGMPIEPPVVTRSTFLQAIFVYQTMFLLLSFYDPQRTFRAVDEYQILTVASILGGVLLGFLTLFTERNTSRLLLVYFYIVHFLLIFAFQSLLRITRRQKSTTNFAQPTALNGYQRAVKRIVDVSLATVMLIVTTPLFFAVAIAIKLDSRGPVLFRQNRVGENGRIFGMYKFRSMYSDAEQRMNEVIRHTQSGQLLHKHPDDPRVTKIGKFIRRTSIDELPQILNVIFGEMSLVGPRPELPMLVERYEPWQHERLRVPQGLTGWWQVNGRSDNPMHLNTEADIYYVRNYSLVLDVQILLKTVWVVLRGKGAY
jgi:lipopolysaccharide/colanic/teichoic acid biosynthesis glycosyltransferase